MQQLSFFPGADVNLVGRPDVCPWCKGQLGMSHFAFARVSNDGRGFYEVHCSRCGTTFRLYRNAVGLPEWELIRHYDDPSWGCYDPRWKDKILPKELRIRRER